MSKDKQSQITLWQGSLDDHPTWRFYVDEIRRVYDTLNTERDRPYVYYELIQRAANAAYVSFLNDEATYFLQDYAKMTWDQANRKVKEVSADIGRVKIKRDDNE